MREGLTRAVALLVAFALFGVLQLVMWNAFERGFFGALAHHPWLWAVYFFPALLVAEHLLNFLNRRRDAGRRQEDERRVTGG
jgi:hypothetical protein